ncbi:SpoIIE family protein phosphatase [Cytobacillus spongiae]|jgi:negative regulator of sigma-B (phosphoserine phosphatase)|uniref:PP2C family serine/threonine-protein phosphatase n=1 Tax=Cytobacillus spongiae TaxID=2901381 RepID=UPI001F166D7C|nr:PP2C family serine/threonine-protein phosphatase [Cytobacillus spongiae]UII56224.1 SpoIIE family protein phosphatase [Cytobacillus spongiae]
MNYVNNEKVEVLAHQTTKEGKHFCGDSFFFTTTKDYFICVLADGLGSGEYANISSSAVISVVKEHHDKDVNTLMNYCNEVLAYKRGAAVLIFKVSFSQREFVYSCVGNIRFFLYSPSGKLTYPLPVKGYLSGRPQSLHTQRFSYEENSKFIIFSDGLDLNGVKSLLTGLFDVRTVAEKIKKNHSSTADDATFILGSLLVTG